MAHDENKEDLKRLEAVFFISGRFLSISELVSLSDLNPLLIKEILQELKKKYQESDSAMEIVEKSGLWKMDVRQGYSDIVNKFATGNSEFSKSEQETLAIIADKQPITQSLLVKIRSNKAYDHIKTFSDLGLIKKKHAGRTYELGLSEDFYNYFNLSSEGKDIIEQLKKEEKNEN